MRRREGQRSKSSEDPSRTQRTYEHSLLTYDQSHRNDRSFYGSEHVPDRRFHPIRRQRYSGQHDFAIGKEYLQSPVRLRSVTDKCCFEQQVLGAVFPLFGLQMYNALGLVSSCCRGRVIFTANDLSRAGATVCLGSSAWRCARSRYCFTTTAKGCERARDSK
jgi:hypothetical protein